LSVKFRMIFNDFQSDKFFLFMVKRLENLPKGPLPKRTYNLIPISDRVSNRYLRISFIIREILNRRNSSFPRTVNFIFFNLLKLEFSHVRESPLFLCKNIIFCLLDLIVSDFAFNCPELIFLQIWRLLTFFNLTWMLCLKSRYASFGSFYFQSMGEFL